MASKRKYAYYLRGNQIAIIEEGLGSGICSLSGYSNATTCTAAGGTWTENSISSDDGIYRSPTATVTDGLEIEYAYSPRYRINSLSTTIATTAYTALNGNLLFTCANITAAADDWIVIRNSEQWNGLHQVHTDVSGASSILLKTKYGGSVKVEASTIYQDVNALNDEADVIDLPEYLSKALVYFVKAKMAEDTGDYDVMVYNQAQFRILISNYKNSRIWGSRKIMTSGSHSIV